MGFDHEEYQAAERRLMRIPPTGERTEGGDCFRRLGFSREPAFDDAVA